MRDQLDTLVDQEESARGPRVERGLMDHEEGSGGGLLGSSFPDYGIDDEDQVWEKKHWIRWEKDGSKDIELVQGKTILLAKTQVWMIFRQTSMGAQTLCPAGLFQLHLPRFSPYHPPPALQGMFLYILFYFLIFFHSYPLLGLQGDLFLWFTFGFEVSLDIIVINMLMIFMNNLVIIVIVITWHHHHHHPPLPHMPFLPPLIVQNCNSGFANLT